MNNIFICLKKKKIGNVDFSVAVAVNFVNDDHTLPVLYECDRYEGPISDGEIVEISCLEDNAEEPDYGYGRHGYALYAQFVTGATGATGVMQQLAICRMDIVLRDSTLICIFFKMYI